MSKKNKPLFNKQTVNVITETKVEGISKLGKKVILSGIILVIAGFYILTKTDPYGQNWASKLSPFLILGGYAVIGMGIIYPDKKQETLPKV